MCTAEMQDGRTILSTAITTLYYVGGSQQPTVNPDKTHTLIGFNNEVAVASLTTVAAISTGSTNLKLMDSMLDLHGLLDGVIFFSLTAGNRGGARTKRELAVKAAYMCADKCSSA